MPDAAAFRAVAETGVPLGADGDAAGGNEIITQETGMKVAIAQDGNEVSGHFGHCQEYALFTVEDHTIVKRELLKNPGHEPGRLPALLAQHKVTHVVAGGMGPKAVDLFCANNIEVFLGVSGQIDSVIRDFIEGKVTQGQSNCHHTHECS